MAEETIKHNQIIEENVFQPAATSADILLAKLNELIKSFKELATLTGKKIPLTDPKTLDEAHQIAAALEKIRDAEKGLTEVQKVQIQAQTIVNKQKKEFRDSLKAETSAYQALQNQYTAAAQKAKELGAAQGIGSKAAKEASKEANTLNQKLKDIDASMGQHSRSVGDYGKALSGTPFGGFISGIGNIGKAFLTNPIGLIITAIVAGLSALKKAFESTEEGQDKMAKGFAIISNVVGSLFKLIQPLANFLFDKVVSAFEAVGTAAGAAGHLIADALSVFGFDAAAKSVNNFIDSTSKAAAAGAKIAEMRDKADDIERELIVERAKLEARIADAKQKAADTENVSASERKKAIEEAIKLTNELANKEEERAELLLAAKKLENEETGATEEDKKELAELEAALFTIQRNRSQDILALQKAEKKGNKEILSQQKELTRQWEEQVKVLDEAIKRAIDLYSKDSQAFIKAQEDKNKAAEDFAKRQMDLILGNLELEAKLTEDKVDDENARFQAELIALENEFTAEEKLTAAFKKRVELNDKLHQKNLADIADDAAKKQQEIRKKQIDQAFDMADQITEGIADGLQKRSDLQQQADQRDIDMHARMLDVQARLAAEGKDNVLAETMAQTAKAEEKKIQDAKKAAKQQEALAIIDAFTSALQTALKDDKKPFMQAFGEALAASGMVSAVFSKMFAGFYEGTTDTGTTDSPLDAKGGRVAVLHDNERVVPKRLNDQLDGISNDELVRRAVSPDLNSTFFPKIAEVPVHSYVDYQVREMTKEIKALRNDMASRPVQSNRLERLGEWTEQIQEKNVSTIIHHKKSSSRPSLRLNG